MAKLFIITHRLRDEDVQYVHHALHGAVDIVEVYSRSSLESTKNKIYH